MYYKKRQLTIFPIITIACILLICMVLMVSAGDAFIAKNSDRELVREVDLIRAYAVQCYALEGSYPPTLKYLEDRYQLMLKRDQFDYIYDVFASNIPPTIQVIPKLSVDRDVLQKEGE